MDEIREYVESLNTGQMVSIALGLMMIGLLLVL